jgi:hypothetical protein
MLTLHKIPLHQFIGILTDLYDSGADFVDISGENNSEGNQLKDTIKITVNPEYLNDDEVLEQEKEIETNCFVHNNTFTTGLFEEDINDLI